MTQPARAFKRPECVVAGFPKSGIFGSAYIGRAFEPDSDEPSVVLVVSKPPKLKKRTFSCRIDRPISVRNRNLRSRSFLKLPEHFHQLQRDFGGGIDFQIAAAGSPGFVAAVLVMLGGRQITVVTIGK
jgi:hypothetical protein